AGPAQHQINAAAVGTVRRAALEAHKLGGALTLGERAERPARHPGLAGERQPFVVCRIDHDRIAIARFWIFHALAVRVLPDRLVAVGGAAALDVVVAAENAGLEGAVLFQFRGAGGDFLARQISAAAGTAELQHRGRGAAVRALRAVRRAFREIAEAAGAHFAVAVEIHGAFELKAKLIEVVPVARRGEIAFKLPDVELKIARRAGRAVEQVPVMERAAAMLQAAFPFDFVGMNDLHRWSPWEP